MDNLLPVFCILIAKENAKLEMKFFQIVCILLLSKEFKAMKNILIKEFTNPKWTWHAMHRRQQRGIKKNEANIVFEHGDREIPAGSNCYHLSISKSRLRALTKDGHLHPTQAEKCQRLVILTDGQSIITTFRQSRTQ